MSEQKYVKYLSKGNIYQGWEICTPAIEMNIGVKPSMWYYNCQCTKCGTKKITRRLSILKHIISPCKCITTWGRICTGKCGRFLTWDHFNKGNSAREHSARCKECDVQYRKENAEQIKVSKRRYSRDNASSISEKNKRDRRENPEKYRKRDRERHLRDKEKHNKRSQDYYYKTKESRRSKKTKYVTDRLKTDPEFKLVHTLRGRIRTALKNSSAENFTSSNILLGCSPEECISHLNDNEFGYSFDDHSLYGNHIDHIIPCAHFDLTSKLEQLICFNYKNLQLLPAQENFAKFDFLLDGWDKLYTVILQDVLEKHPELAIEAKVV